MGNTFGDERRVLAVVTDPLVPPAILYECGGCGTQFRVVGKDAAVCPMCLAGINPKRLPQDGQPKRIGVKWRNQWT